MPTTRVNKSLLGAGIGDLVGGLMGGYDEYRKQGFLDAANADALAQQARKYGLEADALQRDLSRDPYAEAGVELGVSPAQTQQIKDYLTTGKADFGMKDVVAYDENGNTDFSRSGPQPVTITPEFEKLLKIAGPVINTLSRGGKVDDIQQALGTANQNTIGRTINAGNVADVGAQMAALKGEPEKAVIGQLMQGIANGGDYTTMGRALLAARGKGQFDAMSGGALNVLTGQQNLNPIGVSMVGENNAQAKQANAAAQENMAQALLAGQR